MRESNFSFPAQNKACVCITSQLYDRRALDTNSPLPLFNSLTHLTYLTSTSPRIREILTMDGGLERLVRLLRDFCSQPPPPESPSLFYGLTPPGSSLTAIMAKASPNSFDQHAAYRFSLAFQSVVNIGVRGSEAIRSRVVQAGTLDVVGCILETWLKSKGFVTYPSASASGLGRDKETREQRSWRREQRLRELASQQSNQPAGFTPSQHPLPISAAVLAEIEMQDAESTDASVNSTTRGSGMPPRMANTRDRDRSGTIIARPNLNLNVDSNFTSPAHNPVHQHLQNRRRSSRSQRHNHSSPTTANGAGTSNPALQRPTHRDVASASASDASPSRSPSPGPGPGRHAVDHTVGIVDADPSSPTNVPLHGGMNMDINILNLDAGIVMNMREGLGIGALDGNEDLAMGAPPGAPGATVDIEAPVSDINTESGTATPVTSLDIENDEAGMGRLSTDSTTQGASTSDSTPRPSLNSLPNSATAPASLMDPSIRPISPSPFSQNHVASPTRPTPGPISPAAATHFTVTVPQSVASSRFSHTNQEEVPYREEDVLLSLQLLAYLSKYPHVRQAFYKSRTLLGVNSPGPGRSGDQPTKTLGSTVAGNTAPSSSLRSGKEKEFSTNSFLKAFGVGRSANSKDKDKDKEPAVEPVPVSELHSPNVFSLVERFTFRPHPSEVNLPFPPPFLPPEIQYWAGVIMRNACRKDDSRGGIRQCASMVCGKWEEYPREFAKCRRCRKARYCGKECQSKAWAEGHRFWCSAKEGLNPDQPANVTGDEAAREPSRPLTMQATAVREIRTRRDGLTRAGGAGGIPSPTNQGFRRTHGVETINAFPLNRGGTEIAYQPPVRGTHTVTLRLGATPTAPARRPPANPIPIPPNANSVVVGSSGAYESDASFSPPRQSALDIFSRATASPEPVVTRGTLATARRRAGTVPGPSGARSPPPQDEDVEMN